MRKLKKLMLLALALGFGLTAVTGCRTAHGFGEDLEKAGEGIQQGVQ